MIQSHNRRRKGFSQKLIWLPGPVGLDMFKMEWEEREFFLFNEVLFVD